MSGSVWPAVIALVLLFLGLMCVGVYVWTRTSDWIDGYRAARRAERDIDSLYQLARYQIRQLSRDWRQSGDEWP